MVVCINPILSNKVTNLSSLLGFMNITSITSCSQNGTRRRLTEIKVSLNHSSNARNQGRSTCLNITPHSIATGWFTCKTKEKHTLQQGSPSQVSKMMISITGISGLRKYMLPLPNKINATWSYSSVNGMKTTKCYMEIQFWNSTGEDLTDQNQDFCTNNCHPVVKREITNDPCFRDTTNYLAITIKDMNKTTAEPSREGINVAWNSHSPDGMQITKCSTHIQLQNLSTEYQEKNCVLDIIWLVLFPTICVIFLLIISYQLLKEDVSCKAWNCRSNSDHLQEFMEVYERRNALMSGKNTSQQEAPVYLNEIQHEEYRRQPSGHVVYFRENQHAESIINYQGENSSQPETPLYLNEIQHEECRRQLSGHVVCSRENQHAESIINYQGMNNSLQLYGNVQEPNVEGTPAHEYANFLDLAVSVPSFGLVPVQNKNVTGAAGIANPV